MSITLELPPALTQEALGYATVRGTTLEKLFLDYLTAELKRESARRSVMAKFDKLVEKTSSRRTAPYVFNRADAYEEVMA